MLIRILASGCVEDIIDVVAERFISEGRAVRYPDKEKVVTAEEMAILHAENVAGPTGTAGVEMAVFTPPMERAVLTYTRGPRSPRARRAIGG